MESIYRAWARCASDKRREGGQQHVHRDHEDGEAGVAAHECQSHTVEQQRIIRGMSGEDSNANLDVVIADPEAQTLAARSFTDVTAVEPWASLIGVPPDGKRLRVFEHELVWFKDWEIQRTYTISGLKDSPNQITDGDLISGCAVISTGTRRLGYAAMKLFYKEYINAINEDLTTANLSNYVSREVYHNTNRLTISDYVALIQASSDAFDGMRAEIQTLNMDESKQRIVARIEWSGTLKAPLRGVVPNGHAARFSEIVFYQLELGMIKLVWSIVDWGSLEAQMTSRVV